MMTGRNDYLVSVDGENRFVDGLMLTNETEVLPVTGKIVCAFRSHEIGERVVFQWNALFSAPVIDGCAVIDREYIYRIGSNMQNDWCFIAPMDEREGVYQGKLFSIPAFRWEDYVIGWQYLYEKVKAHRIETLGVNRLNPHGPALQAIKYYDLLVNVNELV